MASNGKFMNVSVGAPIVLSEEEHARFQSTGVMPDGSSATEPAPPATPPASLTSERLVISPDMSLPTSTRTAPVGDETVEEGEIKPARRRVEAKEDPEAIHVKGQKYAVVSLVVPPKSDHLALKLRGSFDEMEEAEKHAEEVMKTDPDFDIFIVSMYNWLVLPLPDDVRAGIKHRYTDERLDRIMGKYHEDRIKSKDFNQERIKASKEAGAKGEAGPVQEGAVPTEVVLEGGRPQLERVVE